MSERFFSADPITSHRVTLEGAEAHHLLHVMRAALGQVVTLFDDSGEEFTAVVESLRRSSVDLQIVDRREIDRELPFALTVGVALPKGERQKWLVEKLTELGVTMLVPLTTDRGVAEPNAASLERLRRAAIESAKQCGRNRLLKIAEPQPSTIWFAHEARASETRSPEGRRLVAHPGGMPTSDLDYTQALPTHLAIGPEGGFTDAEIAAATTAGWQAVDLGPRVLRVETAAVALVAAISLAARSSCRRIATNVD
jgi:16S rRNA (uracil1498-N3)-methyltransferase